ncbi:MAG: TIGR02117 family protein [Burkholderiaceae bacterium]|jgi:uncharacterized protein (TIGR02117 family)|nr:TIGR02117 family protein [Burkholderiaceae bacterium]
MRRALRWLAALVALLLAPPLAYLAAAVLLGVLPVNGDWRPTPEERGGVPVWLRTNGVHADLVLPAQSPHDFTRDFPRAALIDLSREPSLLPFNWIAFGWGDRGFYLNTPTWADLEWRTAWRALTAQGPSAMHVEYLRRPEDYDVRLLWLSEDEVGRLVAYIERHVVREATGRPRRIAHPGYFATDAFYEGVGSYSAVLTSNEWVRRGLAEAGVRTARWAPFDRALMWQAGRAAR